MGEQPTDMGDELIELRRMFKVDAEEKLVELEHAIEVLGRGDDAETAIQDIFRIVHTIKGDAGYLQLDSIQTLAHAFESVLDDFRQVDDLVIELNIHEIFLRTVDFLNALVQSAGEDLSEEDQMVFDCLLSDLNSLRARKSSVKKPKDLRSAGAVVFQTIAKQQIAAIEALISHFPDPRCTEKMAHYATQIENAAVYSHYESVANLASAFVQKLTDGSLQEIGAILGQIKEGIAELNRPEAPREEAKSVPLQSSKGAEILSRSMRVDEKVVDSYMNLVGELITARNGFEHIQQALERVEGIDKKILDAFKERAKRLTHISDELRQNAMTMRLVPLQSVFQKYPRIVRDLAQKVGKKVEIIVEGAELEIDKSTLEKIADPMLHIIRNAIDHGLELEDDRMKAGKSPVGMVTLKARNVGTGIQLELSDDGQGLDSKKVIAKAIRNSLISEADAESMTQEEIHDLIFLPGFSTAEKLTEISGRGVGMDIVRSSVIAAKGKFAISSMKGRGTTVTIELPLSAALSQTLLVEADGDAFALPIEAIDKTLKVNKAQLKTVMGQASIVYQERVITVFKLSQLLGFAENLAFEMPADDTLTLLIIHSQGQRVGIIVDKILRREEILVKPLPQGLGSSPNLSGASILGNGSTVLVLEPNQLLSQAS